MPAVFVAGTGTDVGKTYVAAALLRALAAAGQPVDALKPLVSGYDEAAPAGSDPAMLLAALGQSVTPAALDRIAPWRYRAPLAPSQAARLEGRAVDADAVIAFCRARIAAAGETLVLVESAGGIMSPLDDERAMLDFARALAAPILLVAGSYLGTISHTLTAIEVIRRADLPLRAVILSESAEGPELDETLKEIAHRSPGVAVAAMTRGGDAGHLIALVRP